MYYVITRTFIDDPELKDDILKMSKASAEILKSSPASSR